MTEFRIALRTRGKWVRAYIAAIDTMEDAVEIARIDKGLCVGEGRNAFVAMCQALLQPIAENEEWEYRKPPPEELEQ